MVWFMSRASARLTAFSIINTTPTTSPAPATLPSTMPGTKLLFSGTTTAGASVSDTSRPSPFATAIACSAARYPSRRAVTRTLPGSTNTSAATGDAPAARPFTVTSAPSTFTRTRSAPTSARASLSSCSSPFRVAVDSVGGMWSSAHVMCSAASRYLPRRRWVMPRLPAMSCVCLSAHASWNLDSASAM